MPRRATDAEVIDAICTIEQVSVAAFQERWQTIDDYIQQIPNVHPVTRETICQMGARIPTAMQQWLRMQKSKRGLPFLLYRLGPSNNHHPIHAGWDNLILAVDDSWWDTYLPPNGWGCKCHVRALTAREAERRGGPSPRPVLGTYPWINTQTGQTEQVPCGIDPGWHWGKLPRI